MKNQIDERQGARSLLDGLENGRMSGADAAILAEDLDPALLYAIVTFLRATYPASDPAATSVLERVVEMTRHGGPKVQRRHTEGEQDPISQWFESEHSYSDFRGRGSEMIDIITDKIES